MKRLNPETKEPFKKGFVRKDGYLFYSYSLTQTIKKTGFYKERWINKDSFDNLVAKNRLATLEWLKSDKGKKVRNKARDKYRITLNGRARVLLDGAKYRCKKYGGTLTITHDWILQRLKSGICELTDLPFDFNLNNTFNQNPYAPSLDRINSKNRDYSESNTRVVLVAVNTALSEFGLEVMKPIMERMIK